MRSGQGHHVIRVTGQAGGRTIGLEVPVDLGQGVEPQGALARVWARMKIAELSDQALVEPNPDLPGQIRQVALDYQLLSAYTACVAVDSSRRTEGKEGTTVPVPVPVPDGVKYDTTVPD